MTPPPIPNPLGVHALVWVGDTAPASVRGAVEQTKAAGFDLLELSLHDAANLDVTAAADDLAAADLQVACSRGLSFTADISSDDPATVSKGEELLNESLDITHRLGGTLLTGALYSALGKYGAPLTSSGRRNVVNVLQNLAKEAQNRAMSLGLEVCNRYETNVFNRQGEAADWLRARRIDNVRVLCDLFHMNIEERDAAAALRQVGADRLGHVHFVDSNRLAAGMGHTDFTPIVAALRELNYTGYISAEGFPIPDSDTAAKQSIDAYRRLFNF